MNKRKLVIKKDNKFERYNSPEEWYRKILETLFENLLALHNSVGKGK